MTFETLVRWKKGLKKSYIFLNGPALYNPPPLLMARPLREELFFSAASLIDILFLCHLSLCTILSQYEKSEVLYI